MAVGEVEGGEEDSEVADEDDDAVPVPAVIHTFEMSSFSLSLFPDREKSQRAFSIDF